MAQFQNSLLNEEEKKKNLTGTQNAGAKPTPTTPAANIGSPTSVLSDDKQSMISNPAAHHEDTVLDSGLTNGLAGAENKTPATVGVRSVLEGKYGVDSDDLGYDGEYVTLNGKPLIKPQENRDGTTYVQSEEEILQGLSAHAAANGHVAVRDYANSRGIPMDIKWNEADGTVSINGRSVKPTYIIDGKAYVPQSQLDELLKLSEKDMGISRDSDILAESEQKYGSYIEDAFQKFMNSGDFSYSAKEDKAYQDFMDAYRRGVQDEYNANMAQARFRTGGVPSSAVMQQAAAIREGALDDALKYRQQFEDRAYDRWQDSRGQAYDEMMAALGMLENEYGLRSGANAKTEDAYYKNRNFDVEMRNALLELGLREAEVEQILAYMPDMYRYEWENARYETDNNKVTRDINQDFGYATAKQGYEQNQLAGLGEKAAIATAILNAIIAESESGIASGVDWKALLKDSGLY